MYKIDLHTHSSASPDGALLARDYRKLLQQGSLDYIAVTDHNTISFAQKLRGELGAQIIVGEEITAREGEVIGLYLSSSISPGQSVEDTVKAIHEQNGLVYIPHPFETVRKGVSLKTLDKVADEVDIIEIRNGRAIFQNKSSEAQRWSARHSVAGAASSDAHGFRGWGKTCTVISEVPTADNLVELLKDAQYARASVGMIGALYPKLNRFRKKVRSA